MLEETGLDEVIQETSTKGLFIAPSGESLIGLEINLANMIGRENVLSHSLNQTKSLNQFDVIIIDNPPFISLTTLNSLVASDYYLVPLSCEYLPMLGLKWLNRTVEKVKKLNPKLTSIGVALTMYDQRQAITKSVEELVREELGDLVFETRIRVSTKHKTAPTVHKTIFQFEPGGKGASDYMGLTGEVMRRLGYEHEG
jgi:chromosome partitioning protein